jgi:hypothetical protein
MSLSRKLGLNDLEFLLSRRSFLTNRTKRPLLEGLIGRLHPVDTDIPLRRLGPAGDGGYLVPDDLDGIVACFSPGVSTVSGFEQDCAELGMQVFMADASVEGPAMEHQRFSFAKRFVGAFTDGDFISLEDWVAESGVDADSDLLLQMDIEGFEYETLLGMPARLLNRFRVLVIECHRLDQLWNRYYFQFVSRAFEKLLTSHHCVHIHPNNAGPVHRHAGIKIPVLAEFTFMRKDRACSTRPATRFPHPLDSDNLAQDSPSLILPRNWYG